MYALVDCNNFYASCEQVFNPAYRNKPLVVLSNNDGCVVARSKEAKALGIPMGAPAFQWETLFLRENVIVLSSNYTLYGDLSHRVIETMKTFDLPLEIYSIDEAFLLFPEKEGEKLAQEMRMKILQWTGIPVSIGLAPTKTLAKVAGHVAKKGKGVALYHPSFLETLPIDEIWGIGRQLKKKLLSFRIQTAQELIQKDEVWVKKHLTVTGLKTVLELRGIPCIEHLEHAPERKSIVSSRTFSKGVCDLAELKETLATFGGIAAKKLRKEKLKAYFLLIFLYKDRFVTTNASMHLPLATHYTPDITRATSLLLEKIYEANVSYRKGGVLLSGLVSETEGQLDLFATDPLGGKKEAVIHTFDQVNKRYGGKILTFAAEGLEKKWKSASSKRSPNYTTSWNDIPTIRNQV
ncbi:MAG: Y-family DNA polymerase [Chlamydiia bacterium]|nr:Y-family DNA polymerase [Chlamydiia bacterium]